MPVAAFDGVVVYIVASLHLVDGRGDWGPMSHYIYILRNISVTVAATYPILGMFFRGISPTYFKSEHISHQL